MAGEYDNVKTGRMLAADYPALTGDYAPSDTVDMAHDLIGLNAASAGYVKILTAAGTTTQHYLVQGDNGTAPIRRIFATGATSPAATLVSGII